MALRATTPHHTVELVWFNGEEQGLFGSRHAASHLGDVPLVAMINLDMVGVPVAVNALGDDSLVPALQRWHAAREEYREELETREGAANYAGLQRFLACVHRLSAERRLSRYCYLAEK